MFYYFDFLLLLYFLLLPYVRNCDFIFYMPFNVCKCPEYTKELIKYQQWGPPLDDYKSTNSPLCSGHNTFKSVKQPTDQKTQVISAPATIDLDANTSGKVTSLPCCNIHHWLHHLRVRFSPKSTLTNLDRFWHGLWASNCRLSFPVCTVKSSSTDICSHFKNHSMSINYSGKRAQQRLVLAKAEENFIILEGQFVLQPPVSHTTINRHNITGNDNMIII